MNFCPLDLVADRIALGEPLPFAVYDPEGRLLLARGQVVDSADRLAQLRERGMQVDLEEARGRAEPTRPGELQDESPETALSLAGRWRDAIDHVAALLRGSQAPSFRMGVDAAGATLAGLIALDPDLAIFQVVRTSDNPNMRVGIRQALRASIVAALVSRRLLWSDTDTQRALKAALTMNLSMFELQGVLAEQTSALTGSQREQLLTHPQRSRLALERAGVRDPLWLDGVLDHHERADGSGYPARKRDFGELASLLQRADIYTAKLSARAGRAALPADRAGRELFMSDPGSPMTSALVKEFGIFPPGCYVALRSGEVGIVVRRGPTVLTPIVSVVRDARDRPLTTPLVRSTAEDGYAVLHVVPPPTVGIQGRSEFDRALSSSY